jgi:hypothetical protein
MDAKHELKPVGGDELLAWNSSDQKKFIDNHSSGELQQIISVAYLYFQMGVTTFMEPRPGRSTLFEAFGVEIEAEQLDHPWFNLRMNIHEDSEDDKPCLIVDFDRQGDTLAVPHEPGAISARDCALSYLSLYGKEGVVWQATFFCVGIIHCLEDLGYEYSNWAFPNLKDNTGRHGELTLWFSSRHATYKWVRVRLLLDQVKEDAEYAAVVVAAALNQVTRIQKS